MLRGWLFTSAALTMLFAAGAASAATSARVYQDAVGDAESGHGDIAQVVVSDVRGDVTMKVTVLGLRSDAAEVELATRKVARSSYVLSFTRSGAWRLESESPPGDTLRDVSHLPGVSFSRSGNVYAFRFGNSVLKGATRFFFEVHVDTPTMADVSDWAPDGDYSTPNGWWRYTLASGSR